MFHTYDLIVVGAGPAGLTAAMYAGRKKLNTLIIAEGIGGQPIVTPDIENYPGFKLIDGKELIHRFTEHVKTFGIKIHKGSVTAIRKERVGVHRTGFVVRSGLRSFKTRTVIIAAGRTKRHLLVPGEQELLGKGVTLTAAYHTHLFRGKRVAIVGAGNSAFVTVRELLRHNANEIHIITNMPELTADEVNVALVKKHKIKVHTCAIVKAILGHAHVEGITFIANGVEKTVPLDGVYVDIGWVPSTSFAKHLVTLNESNEIVIDTFNMTNVPGIFAAGDITNVPEKQIIVACGEGAKAAICAHNYIHDQNGCALK